jgi:hypothetical protein
MSIKIFQQDLSSAKDKLLVNFSFYFMSCLFIDKKIRESEGFAEEDFFGIAE